MFLHSVTTFMSENDIEAGVEWFTHITGNLAAAQFGIVCVTPENLDSRWLNYEAGALANHLTSRTDGSEPDQVKVVPLVWGMKKTDVVGPLGNRHAVELAEVGMRSIAKSVNSEIEAIYGTQIEAGVLEKQFMSLWPDFEMNLATIPKEAPAGIEVTERGDDSKLDEVLELVRRLTPEPAVSQASATGRLHTRALVNDLVRAIRDLNEGATLSAILAEMSGRGHSSSITDSFLERMVRLDLIAQDIDTGIYSINPGLGASASKAP